MTDLPPARAPFAHLVVAGVSGLAVTVLEFGAVRFMAPSFGQSNYVWANVIGIILLSLALGYWLGGRIADRSRSGRPLYAAYVLAALYAVAIAFWGRPLCEWLVPAGIGNERLLPLAFTGSLVATVLLFGPPVLVLGMTSPFLIRLDTSEGHAGRTAGRIFAVGTLGSLAGCYLAPLWLLQAAGSRLTILLCAAALALLGLGGLWYGKRPLLETKPARTGVAAAGLVLLLSLGLVGYAYAADWPLREDEGQLVEIESAYQTVRVVEQEAPMLAEGDLPLYGETLLARTRFLRHDEDADTYQSVWLPGRTKELLTGGRYYDHLALGAYLDGLATKKVLRVLVIGYAGGAVHRILEVTKPEGMRLEVLGIEIDPAVVEAAKDHLGLEELLERENVEVITGEDARTVLNALSKDERFDLILLDAYARTTYVPFQLASRELFGLLASHLTDEGWIGVNAHAVGGLGGHLVASISTTIALADGLQDVWVVPNPLFPGSIVIWAARKDSHTRAPRITADTQLPATLRTPALALERLTVLHVPGRDGGHLLTDDKSDVDRLSDKELMGR